MILDFLQTRTDGSAAPETNLQKIFWFDNNFSSSKD
jgi:hypothetical protein